MNDQTDPKTETPTPADDLSRADTTPAANPGGQTADAPTAAEETSATEPDPVEALTAENAGLRDRLMLTIADMENLRRRTEREKQDASRYAIGRFAEDILSVSDNLARALAAVDPATKDAEDEATRNLIDGIEVTERGLQNVLSRHGIQRLDPEGDRFDPNFHQAIFEVENPAVASGIVVQVVQAGYTIGDRVLRPAMVGVSKGGPKAMPETQDSSAPDSADAEPGDQVDRNA